MKNKKGFTLIELLVVIAIIGILSAIGLIALNGAREKARDAQRKSDIGQMRTGLALYYDDSSAYPTAVPADHSWNNNAAATNATGVFLPGGSIITKYLSGELKDPNYKKAADTHYYQYSATTSEYNLWTVLEASPGTRLYWTNEAGLTYDYGDTKTSPGTCTLATGLCTDAT